MSLPRSMSLLIPLLPLLQLSGTPGGVLMLLVGSSSERLPPARTLLSVF